MAIKRAFVPGAKKSKSRRHMGGGTRSPVIGRIKSRSMGGKRGR